MTLRGELGSPHGTLHCDTSQVAITPKDFVDASTFPVRMMVHHTALRFAPGLLMDGMASVQCLNPQRIEAN